MLRYRAGPAALAMPAHKRGKIRRNVGVTVHHQDCLAVDPEQGMAQSANGSRSYDYVKPSLLSKRAACGHSLITLPG